MTAIPQIESLETKTRDILRFLRSLRNTFLPVNRLPPEVISHIVRCVLGDHTIDTTSVVPLTHVCQYWRNSVVSTPDNWTPISSEREDLAALSLERAKAAPLTVHLDLSRPESKIDSSFLKLLQPHTQKIRSLFIPGIFASKELVRVLPNFPKSMPDLQSLILTGLRRTN